MAVFSSFSASIRAIGFEIEEAQLVVHQSQARIELFRLFESLPFGIDVAEPIFGQSKVVIGAGIVWDLASLPRGTTRQPFADRPFPDPDCPGWL